jgi:hypothetical protein
MRCNEQLEKEAENMCYLAIGYMQMTSDEMEEWDSDPSEFAAVEDETKSMVSYSVRRAAMNLALCVADTFETKGLGAVGRAATKRIAESSQARGQAKADWWKLTEAALWTVVRPHNYSHPSAQHSLAQLIV